MADRERNADMEHPELDLVRQLKHATDAPAAEVAAARRVLQAAIAAEKAPRRSWMVRLAPAVATVAVLAVVALIGSQLIRPTSAIASLTEVAAVAERLDPLVAPPGSAIYVRSDRTNLVQVAGEDVPGSDVLVVSFLLPQIREVWIRQDGTRRISVTNGEPVFFSPAVGSAFTGSEAAAALQVGETVVTDLGAPEVDLPIATLSTDPDVLRTQLIDLASEEASNRSDDAVLFETVAGLLRETDASPALRGALIRVIASLGDAIEVEADGDVVNVSLDYSVDGLDHIRRIQLDRSTAALTTESVELPAGDPTAGVPAGTKVVDARYTAPAIVTLP